MPTAALTRKQALLYSAGSVGTGAFYAFNNFVLPQVLKATGAGDLLTGLLASTRSIEGALIQPAVGALSDRTRTRLGRRRPYIVVGIPLSAAGLGLAATQHELLGLSLAIVAFSLFFNAAADPYVALLADLAAPGERGILQGTSTAIQLASQVALLALLALAVGAGPVPAWSYALVAGLLIIGFGITVVGVAEPAEVGPLHPPDRPPDRRPHLRRYLAELLEQRAALRYLAAVFTFMVGFSAILPYLTLFITVDIGQTGQVALALAAATLLLTAIAAIGFGKLADRIGSKPVLVAGWAILAVAAAGGLVIRTLPEAIAVVALAGVGNGAATAAGWPLLVSLVPPERIGVFAGLKAAAESIAIPLSVVVAAVVFLPRFSYRGVFALLELAIIVALVILVRSVHVPVAAVVTTEDRPVER